MCFFFFLLLLSCLAPLITISFKFIFLKNFRFSSIFKWFLSPIKCRNTISKMAILLSNNRPLNMYNLHTESVFGLQWHHQMNVESKRARAKSESDLMTGEKLNYFVFSHSFCPHLHQPIGRSLSFSFSFSFSGSITIYEISRFLILNEWKIKFMQNESMGFFFYQLSLLALYHLPLCCLPLASTGTMWILKLHVSARQIDSTLLFCICKTNNRKVWVNGRASASVSE